MCAQKRISIRRERASFGEVISSGVGGMGEPPSALLGLESRNGEISQSLDSDPKNDLGIVTSPDLDQRATELMQISIFRLRDNAGFCAAMTALEQCHQKVLLRASDRETFIFELGAVVLEMVPLCAARAVMNGRARKGSRERLWSVGTGKTWKALREYPRRLRKMAKEVKSINESPFFGPGGVITSQKPIAIFSKRQFLLLPTTLQRYADWLEAWAEKVPDLHSQHYPPAPRGYSRFAIYMSTLSKLLTGRFCDREVAELLNAADLVLNADDPKSGERFDVQTLVDLRARDKKKVPRT